MHHRIITTKTKTKTKITLLGATALVTRPICLCVRVCASVPVYVPM